MNGPIPHGTVDSLADDIRAERQTALHALHVLEYALSAPAPRRHRTWLHRVMIAADALHAALQTRLPDDDRPIRLLDEIALSHPDYIPRIESLQHELADLAIAVAALQERLEPDPQLVIDPADIRNQLSTLAQAFREHRARESDLIYEATGRNLDEW